MNLLVTGGAGFIGSNFIRYWLAHHPNDTIVNLDKLSYAGNLANLKDIEKNPHYRFVKGDVLDQPLTEKLLAETDVLVHFAAESHVTRSETDPELFYRVNVDGTRSLLKTAAAYKLKRVIHISTDEVYGSIKNGYFKETDKKPGAEQASSAYAKSKSLADDVAQSFFDRLPLIVVRPTNNFGPYQFPEKALPRWITSALLDQPLQVWGQGRQVRDWLFVEDTARALELLIEKAPAPSIYNIGANHQREWPNVTIAAKVLKSLGKSADLLTLVPDPRHDHDWRYGVDTTKIKALGFRPGSFTNQFATTVDWYHDHPEWWRPLKAAAEALYAPAPSGKAKNSTAKRRSK